MPHRNSRVERFRGFLLRQRTRIQDLFLIAATLAVTAFVLYQFDVFATGPKTKEISPDEMPILAIVLCVGMLFFTWRRAFEQRRETRKRLAAEARARELAMQDPLTGLPNRRQFIDCLNAAIAAPPRAGASHALLMLDLNRFKQVNDLYGHNAGDEALVVIGSRLMGAVRDGDLVARFGGDEFVILARHLAGAEAATGIALRVIEALSPPVMAGGAAHSLGVSIGIALFPFAGANADEVLRRADVALYKAKTIEKSSLCFFDRELDEHVRERTRLEQELRAAIAAGDIEPHFQPLVDLKSKAVVGFEALARWRHKDMGDVAPDRFIPVAEDAGLISQLSDQLLHRACEVALGWPDNVILAFNISPVQLKDATLGLRVLHILGETGLSPRRLEIEITESALVADLESARIALAALRDAGVRLVLDDFGTGYSNLYHLRSFKVDKIKIDRSFVAHMGDERESAAIVKALIGLGQGLGLTITAEGIENCSEGRELLAHGCGQGQGFLFSRAVPAEQTAAFFTSGAGTRTTV
ncbi:MAG TPA: EAL domain-containing protein [Pseudolabrys sp.]|nr:EAL domain-containing protein [Pseudolabrys sp.]